MTIVNLLQYTILLLLIIVPFFFILKTFIDIIFGAKKHRLIMSKINEHSKFHDQLLSWSEEITDQNIKHEYLLHCVEILSNSSKTIDTVNLIDISKKREEIIIKYSNYT